MSRIDDVVKELASRLEFILKTKPIILNDLPPVIDEEAVYIIVPKSNNISVQYMLSTDSWISYNIEIFKIAHVQNMNRQGTVVENIYKTLGNANYFMENIIPRRDLFRVIKTANVSDIQYGTDTFVTDTKVYSAYTMNLMMRDVLED